MSEQRTYTCVNKGRTHVWTKDIRKCEQRTCTRVSQKNLHLPHPPFALLRASHPQTGACLSLARPQITQNGQSTKLQSIKLQSTPRSCSPRFVPHLVLVAAVVRGSVLSWGAVALVVVSVGWRRVRETAHVEAVTAVISQKPEMSTRVTQGGTG